MGVFWQIFARGCFIRVAVASMVCSPHKHTHTPCACCCWCRAMVDDIKKNGSDTANAKFKLPVTSWAQKVTRNS